MRHIFVAAAGALTNPNTAMDAAAAEIARLRAVNAELLAGLKHAVHWFDQLNRHDADKMQAIIDRAEGRP